MVTGRRVAAIFDLDDTLISTSSAILLRLSLLFGKYPIQEGVFYIYHLLANQQRENLLGSKYSFSKEFWRDYEKLRVAIRPKPIGNVKSKLESISKDGFDLGILTNGSLKKVNELFVSSSIDPAIFQVGVYFSENLPSLKPDPKCFSVIKNLKSYYKVFYIGDNLDDYYVARENGVNFKGVCTGLTDRNDFFHLGVRLEDVFPSIQEITFNEKI